MNVREILALAPVLILIVWIGINPQFFTSRMEPSINRVVQRLQTARVGYVNSSPVRERRAAWGIDEPRSTGAARGAGVRPETVASKD
jgi:hypothetical protein